MLALKGKLKNAGPATVTESSAVAELFTTTRYEKPRRFDGIVTVKLLSRGAKVNGKPFMNTAKSPELFEGCPEKERVTFWPGWAFGELAVNCGNAWRGRTVLLLGHWAI